MLRFIDCRSLPIEDAYIFHLLSNSTAQITGSSFAVAVNVEHVYVGWPGSALEEKALLSSLESSEVSLFPTSHIGRDK